MSTYQYSPFIWPVLASTVCITALVVFCWRRRSVPGAVSLAVAMALFLPWTIGELLELTAVETATALFWHRFQALWTLPVLTGMLCFALQFANLDRWLTRRNLALLSVPPVAAAVAMLLNPTHHLIWSRVDGGDSGLPMTGVGRWVLYGYAVSLALAITLVFVWLFVRSPLHRWPAAVCLCGQAVARVGGVLDASGANPFEPIDAMMLGGAFASAMYVIALFGFRMFDVAPIARQTVIAQMREGMLVLDAQRRIIDCNPAAEKILGLPSQRLRGRDADEILQVPAPAQGKCDENLRDQPEISVGSGSSCRHFAIQSSPLTDRRECPLGHVILLHDVTDERSAQARILEQRQALAALQERDRVARELHDSIGQVLGYLKMQVQAARALLKQHPEQADAYLEQAATVAQDSHADVREYILGARTGLSAHVDFVTALREYVRQFNTIHGIEAELIAPPEMDEWTLTRTTEVQLLRVIQEALTNVRKHARARSVLVTLRVDSACIQALVADNGVGFDPSRLDGKERRTFGLDIMRERAEDVGGTLQIESAPGDGTRVVISVPLQKDSP
ncbi:MAG: histidine kinase [Candidatus Nanopelagicales bacterium]|jgi:PAS domain S-box-containing protein|nr:histidine kinase [Candidatus Nanopelagicales bacterium]